MAKSYRQAMKQPKGGAVDMDRDGMQAIAAEVLGRKWAMQPKAIYDWAQRYSIDLSEHGHKLAKEGSGLLLAVINDTDILI